MFRRHFTKYVFSTLWIWSNAIYALHMCPNGYISCKKSPHLLYSFPQIGKWTGCSTPPFVAIGADQICGPDQWHIVDGVIEALEEKSKLLWNGIWPSSSMTSQPLFASAKEEREAQDKLDAMKEEVVNRMQDIHFFSPEKIKEMANEEVEKKMQLLINGAQPEKGSFCPNGYVTCKTPDGMLDDQRPIYSFPQEWKGTQGCTPKKIVPILADAKCNPHSWQLISGLKGGLKEKTQLLWNKIKSLFASSSTAPKVEPLFNAAEEEKANEILKEQKTHKIKLLKEKMNFSNEKSQKVADQWMQKEITDRIQASQPQNPHTSLCPNGYVICQNDPNTLFDFQQTSSLKGCETPFSVAIKANQTCGHNWILIDGLQSAISQKIKLFLQKIQKMNLLFHKPSPLMTSLKVSPFFQNIKEEKDFDDKEPALSSAEKEDYTQKMTEARTAAVTSTDASSGKAPTNMKELLQKIPTPQQLEEQETIDYNELLGSTYRDKT